MISGAAAAAVNVLMRRETWPLERLRPFAGSTALFRIPPLQFAFTVLENGELAAAAPEAAPAAIFTLTPSLLARIAAGDESARQEVAAEGDTGLAEAVLHLSKHLRWDFEEDLSRVFGDVLAHRLAESARGFARWQSEAAIGFAHAVAEYWTEERPLIARSTDVAQFVQQVDRLRNDVDRLEKRIEKLLNRQDSKK